MTSSATFTAMKKLILLFGVLFIGSSTLAECTLGSGEDSLVLHRVMVHFGRGATAAGALAREGQSDSASVDAKDYQTAIALVVTARDCAKAVLENRIEALQPAKAKELPDAEKAALLERFYGHMNGFEAALSDILTFLSEAQAKNPAEVDFNTLEAKQKRVMELASAVHTDIG